MMHRLHPFGRQLRSHFLFEINGDRIAYCYIRKNACSAFKRLILDESGYTGKWDDSLSFLESHCGARSLADVRSARWRIYVFRNPFERASSLFRNKMVMQEGAADFLRNYERETRSNPLDATFEHFVTAYLTRRTTDPHAWKQSGHLLPVSYNVIATMETLLDDMRPIVGDDLAARYFSRPTNDTSGRLFDETCFDWPVRILRERYTATGQLPSSDALGNDRLRAAVARIYSADYKLAPDRNVPART